MRDDPVQQAAMPALRPVCSLCLALIAGLSTEVAAFVLFEAAVPGGFSGNTLAGAVCILTPAAVVAWGVLQLNRRGTGTSDTR